MSFTCLQCGYKGEEIAEPGAIGKCPNCGWVLRHSAEAPHVQGELERRAIWRGVLLGCLISVALLLIGFCCLLSRVAVPVAR